MDEPENAENLIDREAWQGMKAMTEPAFLVELVDLFFTDSPELIQQMRAGTETGDIEGVRRAAHSLKSNSASFGANRLAEASRELEMLAKGGTLEGAGEKIRQIEAEYQRLTPVLMELKNEL